MLAVADLASRFVYEVVASTAVPTSSTKGRRDVSGLQHRAIWFMAVIAARSVRACMAEISIGYEEQAVGYTRLVTEVLTASQNVVTTTPGNTPAGGLWARTATGSKLVDQQFYRLVSGPLHASISGIVDWLAIPADDGNHNVVVGPDRRSEGANATLVFLAGAARHIAVQLAAHRGLTIDVSQLDEEINAGQAKYLVAHEGR